MMSAGAVSVFSANTVTCVASDDAPTDSAQLVLVFRNISNEDDVTNVSFDMSCFNTPFSIYKAEWINCDEVKSTLEPFELIVNRDDNTGKYLDWHISLDFPFSDTFDETDALILHTDHGLVRCPTSYAGHLQETIDLLRSDYEHELDALHNKTRNAWILTVAVIVSAMFIGAISFLLIRRKMRLKRDEIEELSLLIAEKSHRNLELQDKVNALYESRLDTLNMLCNEYFEKKESDKIRLTLFNEVEHHILALRDPKTVLELEGIVNTYLDNILVKVRQQVSFLDRKDMRFLTYLYAGFSPRAICIFTDIKLKNFYNRRSRLRDRIIASDAPDKELFVSMM